MFKATRLLSAPFTKMSTKPLLKASDLVYRPMDYKTDADGLARLIVKDLLGISADGEREAAELQRQKNLLASHAFSKIIDEGLISEDNSKRQVFLKLYEEGGIPCERYVASAEGGTDVKDSHIIYGTALLNHHVLKFGSTGYPFSEFPGQESCLQALVVSKEYRRLGIGSRLVGFAAENARRMGLDNMYYVIHSSKDKEILFLEKNGFKLTGEKYNRDYQMLSMNLKE